MNLLIFQHWFSNSACDGVKQIRWNNCMFSNVSNNCNGQGAMNGIAKLVYNSFCMLLTICLSASSSCSTFRTFHNCLESGLKRERTGRCLFGRWFAICWYWFWLRWMWNVDNEKQTSWWNEGSSFGVKWRADMNRLM